MQRLTAWTLRARLSSSCRQQLVTTKPWRPILPTFANRPYTTPHSTTSTTTTTTTAMDDPRVQSYREKLHSRSNDVWTRYQELTDSDRALLERQDFVQLRSQLWSNKSMWGAEEKVLQVLQDMKALGHAWTILEYNEYFMVKLFQARHQDILDTFAGDEFQQAKLPLTIGSFNVLLATYLQLGKMDEAIELIQTAHTKWGVQPDIRDFQRTMYRCLPRDTKIAKQARELITRHTLANNLDILRSNLAHLVRENRMNDAKYVYSNIKDVKLDVSIYSILIKGFMDDKQPREAAAVYDAMQKAGIPPNKTICTALLPYFAQQRDPRASEKIIEATLAGGHTLDETIYNQLLRVYLKSRETRKALAIFEAIQRDPKLRVNDVILNTLLDGLLMNREMDAAKLLYDQMVQTHIKPDRVTFNTLLKGFVRIEDYASALQVIQHMYDAKCEPDIVTFTTLLDGVFARIQPQSANQVFEYLHRTGMKPNIYTFNAVINKFIQQEQMAQAEEAVDMLRHNGLKPTIHTYTNLIQGYVAINDLRNAMLTFQSIVRTPGLKPDRASYHFIICGFLNNNRISDAVTCLIKMRKDKCMPTTDTWRIMMNECIRRKDWTHGAVVVKEMDNCGFSIKSPALQRAYRTLKDNM
ncbi:pentatricopeptide repeat-containing proteinmitochondrial-like [Lichtheimia corymbifera JMRC:FSU:9682]|uniref:Pentatricopeptide repeat-containing proteinmitochondrial-like n=1 Tax=Lichtheimia corymbifera JMRC:FSU:9682 TaxID=1263082 RepID=A0A068RT37_9FUNG|nr:pentatricopeptide repeat-containing proteinmitochondrial-like [Lichtheimia corymbifera JMRC:FSU:9682]